MILLTPFEMFSLDSPGCKLKDADWSEVSCRLCAEVQKLLEISSSSSKGKMQEMGKRKLYGRSMIVSAPSLAIDRNDCEIEL